jgi:hypothetical protein
VKVGGRSIVPDVMGTSYVLVKQFPIVFLRGNEDGGSEAGFLGERNGKTAAGAA